MIKLERSVETGRHRRLAPREEAALLEARESTPARADHRGPGDGLQARRNAGAAVAERGIGDRAEGRASRPVSGPDGREDQDESHAPCARVCAASCRARASSDCARQEGTKARRACIRNEVGERFGSIRTTWRATCHRAKIADLRFHDLRREFASRLLESGAPQHVVRDFLGHANITTTSRYLATTPTMLEHAVHRFEEHQNGSRSRTRPRKTREGAP